MDQETFSAVDEFVAATIVPQDEALTAAVAAAEAAGLPSIQVSPAQGRLLQLLARLVGARQVLEFGTLGGYSTILLARALADGGRLISLEANPEYAAVATRNIAAAGLEGSVVVRVGPALEALPELAAEGAGPFDLVFIDADKVNTPNYFAWALEPHPLGRPDRRRQRRPRRQPRRGGQRRRRDAGAAAPARDAGRGAAGRGDDDPDRRRQGLRRLPDRARAVALPERRPCYLSRSALVGPRLCPAHPIHGEGRSPVVEPDPEQ